MRLPWRRGYIEAAAWLCDDVLLAVGWSLARAESLDARVESQAGPVAVDLHAHGVSRPDVPDCPHPAGKVLVLRIPGTSRTLKGDLVIDGDGGRFVTSPGRLNLVLGDAATIASARLGWLSVGARGEIVTFLVNALAGPASPPSVQVAESLRDIRRILRPPARVDANADHYAHLDHIFRLDERSFYLTGWVPDTGGEAVRLTAVSPEGQRAELLPGAFRHRRTDLADRNGPIPGFAAFLRLDGPSLADIGWTVEHVGADDAIHEHEGPRVVSDGAAAQRAILDGVQFDDPARPALIPNHAFPALARLTERRESEAPVREVIEAGAVPGHPDISLVVPLFKRLDLVEHQLAHFVQDPDIGSLVELVFVLDSPELAPEAKQILSDLHSLYRVPFRCAILARHSGFSLANNAGVSLANGRLAVLLNSDVFPAQPGWAGRMTRVHDATPRIGALGPKLLFEDGTLQHAGVYFERPSGCAVWMNKHYYKGFDRRLPAANVARRVPAVTGACLMIARQLFREMGGLRGCYPEGDYEDSDLCLRLTAAGYENWYVPDVELYHLEGQSYRWDAERTRRSFYNAWVHDHFWKDRIEAIMRDSQTSPMTAPRG
jgi:hypothetical protein